MNMQNKIYSSLALSFFAITSNASFYVLAGAGGNQTTANWNINSSASFANPADAGAHYVLPYGTTSSEEDQTGIGQLGVGYGMRFYNNTIFLGLEAAAIGFDPQPRIENKVGLSDNYQSGASKINTQLKSKTVLNVVDPDISLTLKLGRNVSHYGMLYLKGGVVYNELELKSNTEFTYINPVVGNGIPTTLISTLNATETQKVTGFIGAVGLEQLLSRYVAMNIEYSYANYGKINIEDSAPTSSTIVNGSAVVIIPDGLTTDSGASVDRQAVMLNLLVFLGKQYK